MSMRALAAQLCRDHIRRSIAAAGTVCLVITANAQETADPFFDNAKPLEEIVVFGRDAGRIDIDALLIDEVRTKVIRAFLLEQQSQAKELWRLTLRSSLQRKSSRIAWGYDAQSEAARFRYSQAGFLPIDRVRPATFVSIRF